MYHTCTSLIEDLELHCSDCTVLNPTYVLEFGIRISSNYLHTCTCHKDIDVHVHVIKTGNDFRANLSMG